MSSMLYTASQIDPATGLPKKKNPKAPVFNPQQFAQSVAQNPNSTFGPSPGVDYGFGTQGAFRLPGAPDYKKLIESLTAPLRLEFGAQGAADAASAAAQAQRAFTLFGEVPDQIPGVPGEFLSSAATPEVRQLAEQNTASGLSVKGRLDKQFKDQIRQIKNALAARGALRSGEAAHGLQEAQLGRDQADFDSRDALGQMIAGIQAGLVEADRQRKLQEAEAMGRAEVQVRQDYPAEAVPAGGYAQGTPAPIPAPPANLPVAPIDPARPYGNVDFSNIAFKPNDAAAAKPDMAWAERANAQLDAAERDYRAGRLTLNEIRRIFADYGHSY